MPYGNPTQGKPTYGGNNPSWQDNANVMCYNCREMGHYASNCPNARASIPYAPLCGNCKQVGHTAEECNGPKREENRTNDGVGRSRDTSAKIVLLPDDYPSHNQTNNRVVNHVSWGKNIERENIAQLSPIGKDNCHKDVRNVVTRARAAQQIPMGNQIIANPENNFPIGHDSNPTIAGSVPVVVQHVPPVVITTPIGNLKEPMGNNEPIGNRPENTSPLVPTMVPIHAQILIMNQTNGHAKNFNPVVNKEFQEYQPAPEIFHHPLKNAMPPIVEKPTMVNPIEESPKILPNNPNWVEQMLPNKQPILPIGLPVKPSKVIKNKRIKPIGIMHGVPAYDILEDLGNLKADISIKQLLGVAPQCRSSLQSNLVQRRARNMVNEVTISPNPGAPMIDVTIDGILIRGVQVDGGSSVNLMNYDTMLSLQLSGLHETRLVLHMAHQSRIKPKGILLKVKTMISGLIYFIDFVVFQQLTPNTSYPILLGRPWLYQAKAKDDWGRGILTIGSGKSKVRLQMYPSKYYGETQWESADLTSDFGYDSDDEDEDNLNANRVNMSEPPLGNKSSISVYMELSPGEYYMSYGEDDDSDRVIESWLMDKPMYGVTDIQSELEPVERSFGERKLLVKSVVLPI
jgi:hypothetical protein